MDTRFSRSAIERRGRRFQVHSGDSAIADIDAVLVATGVEPNTTLGRAAGLAITPPPMAFHAREATVDFLPMILPGTSVLSPANREVSHMLHRNLLALLACAGMAHFVMTGAAEAATASGSQNPALTVTLTVNPDRLSPGSTATGTGYITNNSTVQQRLTVRGAVRFPDGRVLNRDRVITIAAGKTVSPASRPRTRRCARRRRSVAAVGVRARGSIIGAPSVRAVGARALALGSEGSL